MVILRPSGGAFVCDPVESPIIWLLSKYMGRVKYSKSGDLAEGAFCNECWKGGGGEKIKPCC